MRYNWNMDDMMTDQDTFQALDNAPMYADFEAGRPILVWVVEHSHCTDGAILTKPFFDYKTLVWALVEASCVIKNRGGANVDFWKSPGTGWYPHGNVRLAVGSAAVQQCNKMK